jgi:hypothetical protein
MTIYDVAAPSSRTGGHTVNEWATLGLVVLGTAIGFWFGYLAGGTRVKP